MQEVETPEGGVRLRYALAPGDAWHGRISHRSMVAAPEGDVHRSVDLDVRLRVVADASNDPVQVELDFERVSFDARLTNHRKHAAGVIHTNNLPQAMRAGEQTLVDADVRLTLGDRGPLGPSPALVTDLPKPVLQMLTTATDAVLESLVVMPDGPLSPGASWPIESEQASGTGEFEGLYENTEGPSPVARLRLTTSGVDRRSDGDAPRDVEWTEKATVLFAIDGHPVEVRRQRRTEDPVGGAGTSKLQARWER